MVNHHGLKIDVLAEFGQQFPGQPAMVFRRHERTGNRGPENGRERSGRTTSNHDQRRPGQVPEMLHADRQRMKEPMVLQAQGGAEPLARALDPSATAKANGESASHHLAQGGPESEHPVGILFRQIHVLEEGNLTDSRAAEPSRGEKQTDGGKQNGQPGSAPDPQNHRFKGTQPLQREGHQEPGSGAQWQRNQDDVPRMGQHAKLAGTGRKETPTLGDRHCRYFCAKHEYLLSYCSNVV